MRPRVTRALPPQPRPAKTRKPILAAPACLPVDASAAARSSATTKLRARLVRGVRRIRGIPGATTMALRETRAIPRLHRASPRSCTAVTARCSRLVAVSAPTHWRAAGVLLRMAASASVLKARTRPGVCRWRPIRPVHRALPRLQPDVTRCAVAAPRLHKAANAPRARAASWLAACTAAKASTARLSAAPVLRHSAARAVTSLVASAAAPTRPSASAPDLSATA